MTPNSSTLRLFSTIVVAAGCLVAGDWTDYRGPNRDGRSPEKNLPSRWSPNGENLAWKAPYGGRSTPVVKGDHLYVMNSVGAGPTLEERLVCLNADTGKVIWEQRFPVYESDVPPHRISWGSPAVDPETGNVYVVGVGGYMAGFTPAGKKIWERSLAEEMGLVTTHGGRTVSPVVDKNLVIFSGVTTGWGDQARAGHRFMAFHKLTGQSVWVSSPGGRPFDTTYSPPIIATVNGQRLFIAGGSDGTIHAIKPETGEPVWKYEISKRGINTGVLVMNGMALVSHSEENLDSSEMGLLAAVDATKTGTLTTADVKWAIKGFQGGFSNPVMDGDRVFQVDNGANLFAFDFVTGKELWKKNLGTLQKASPVLADGKIYLGTENGKFYILQPHSDKVDVLSEVALGTPERREQVWASPAVSNGRVYFVTYSPDDSSIGSIYAIGKKQVSPNEKMPPSKPAEGKVAFVQVIPTELVLKPGEKVSFRVRLFNEKGEYLKDATAVEWALAGLKGDLANGQFTGTGNAGQAGLVKATVGGVTGQARVRVIPPLPIDEKFESFAPQTAPAHWVNTTGKFQVREVDGTKVLVKLADNPFTKRARAFFGPIDWNNYTIECDVRAGERRRQLGDAGVVAQRYQLTIFGNHQRLELVSWQPEVQRTQKKEFAWKKDTWYRLKLTVENLPDGKTRARGKVWAVGEQEPAGWMVEYVDPIPNTHGSPGIYADALEAEVFFDNLKVTPNK